MSWRDELQDASFRGVPFKVKASQLTAGRRVDKIERYDKRTVTRDMGPELPTFELEAYVIQNSENDFNYFSERDALIEALNKSGIKKEDIGVLVHPFFGSQKVHAERYTVEETFDEGGIARFRITFLLEDDELFPGESKDYTKQIDAKVDTMTGNMGDLFLDKFNSTVSFVDSIGRDIIYQFQRMQTSVMRINGAIKSTLATTQGIITAAIETTTSILSQPSEIFDTIKDAINAFGYLVGLSGTIISNAVIGAYSGKVKNTQIVLDGNNIPQILGVSLVDQLILATQYDEENLISIAFGQEKNRALVINTFKILLLLLAARIAIRIQYSSQEDMFSVLGKLASAIEETLLRFGEQIDVELNDMFIALEDIRSLLFKSMIEKSAELSRTLTYEIRSGVESTLELAYDLYENIDREEEIITRNSIKHPGFAPSGELINILEV